LKVLTNEDSGSVLALSDGEGFEVCLPESAGTGYQWIVTDVPEDVCLVGDDVVVGRMTPGAQGLHRFRFLIRQSPGGRVALELRRTWERASMPESAFEVRLAPTTSGSSVPEDRPNERSIEDLDDTV
jgi:predicted secreted protein